MAASQPRSRQPRQLDAGRFQAEIRSFRLHLAAEGKAAKTVRTYTGAVQWFGAAYLREETGHAGWGQVDIGVWQREIIVRGKGGKTRIVKITYDAARILDRYLRVRARHAQAHRPQLWLGPATEAR